MKKIITIILNIIYKKWLYQEACDKQVGFTTNKQKQEKTMKSIVKFDYTLCKL